MPCWKKGVDQGYLICYDGYKQDMSKENGKYTQKKEIKNLRAAAAFGQEVYEAIQQNCQEQSNNTQKNAFQLQTVHLNEDDEDRQEAKPSIFNRIKRICTARNQIKDEKEDDKLTSIFERMEKSQRKKK